MPTIFSHAVFSAAAGKAALGKTVFFWFWILTAFCAIVPDFDVVGRFFGVERGGMFAHRGFTHSIVFAILFGFVVAFFVHKRLKTGLAFSKLTVYFSLAVFSHPLLDMLTDGGPGVALFAPFTGERFFFPWRPVEVSPIGLGFFSARGVDVIVSEFIWIWLPAIVILGLSVILRRNLKRR